MGLFRRVISTDSEALLVALVVAVPLALFGWTGCGGSDDVDSGTPDAGTDVTQEAETTAADGGEDSTPDIAAPPPALAICEYTNPFSQGLECKEYTGAGWTLESATTDCGAVLLGTAGELSADASCDFESELGRCNVDGPDDTGYVLVSAGTDSGLCGSAQAGCEVFAGGTFVPGEVCEGIVGPPPNGGYGDVPFIQPYLDCRDPLPGEPPGLSEGKVCTWVMISGCTEPGRRFDDYASCEDVLTQRPYYASPTEPETSPDDPRLDDVAYMAEVAWVREQVEACACICCHSTRSAPDGPSWWYVEADPIWLDSVFDSGMAMMAGLAESDALGAYPAEDNNGFDRTTLGLPTNDIPRMQAFLLAEWDRRGYTPEEGAEFPAFGGPIVDQQRYEPSACEDGEGIAADGTVTWQGGEARYVYVLPRDAANPGVPPNLDEPAGTLWLVDIATDDDAISPPLSYGELTGELRQRIPTEGTPPALTNGTVYYLYVLKDIGFPITRCLFTYPTP